MYDHTSPKCMCPDCHAERMIYCSLSGKDHTTNHYTRFCPNNKEK